MPGVSDPGYRLVALAVRHHIRVVPIPGAIGVSLGASRQRAADRLVPLRRISAGQGGARRTLLEAIRNSPRTEVFYEAPHRIVECLRDIVELLGPERHVVIAREVTKLHEEFLRGRAEDVLATLEKRGEVRGEITLLIGKAEEAAPAARSTKTVAQRVQELMRDEKLDEKTALKQAAKEFGLSKSEAYRELQRSK